MSLNITTQIETLDGFTLDQSYGRVSVSDELSGAYLNAQVYFYANEAGFESGKAPLSVSFVTTSYEDYNRDTDGSDILDIAHDRLIAVLADQGIDATKVL